MQIKKTRLLIILLLFFATKSFSQLPLVERDQTVPRERFIDRLYFGGGFGMQFGSSTYIEVAPIVGYKLTERFSAGLGIKYIYYKLKDNFYTYSTNIYGGGPFARFFIIEGLFAHAEYEVLNMEVPADITYTTFVRRNVTSVFLGGGYRQMIGDNSSLDLLLLYNINDNKDSPYQNPVIRIGFSIGI